MTIDQFGNPITLDAVPPISSEGRVTTETTPPPDSTLTGGVFRTDTSTTLPPLPRERPRPPATDTSETAPPPITNTSSLQPSTNTSPP
jgi:hypothetical protein